MRNVTMTMTDKKATEVEVALKKNRKRGLPDGVNWNDSPLMDFSANPRLTKFMDLVRQISVAHMAFHYAGLIEENVHAKILDAGAGFAESYHLMVCMRKGAGSVMDWIGIDVEPERQDAAISLYPRLDYRLGNLVTEFDTTVPERDFDVVISSEVLEHLTKDHGMGYLADCVDRLRKGGHLILTTPNESIRWINPHHLYEWPFAELVDLVGELPLDIVDQFFSKPRIKEVEKTFDLGRFSNRVPNEIIRGALIGHCEGSVTIMVLKKR